MKKTVRKGFVILVILVFLALLPLAVTTMSKCSRIMISQTARAREDAQMQNLILSGSAWARKNAGVIAADNSTRRVDLDVSALGIKEANCTIIIERIDKGKLTIRIEAGYTNRQQRLDKSEIFVLGRNI